MPGRKFRREAAEISSRDGALGMRMRNFKTAGVRAMPRLISESERKLI